MKSLSVESLGSNGSYWGYRTISGEESPELVSKNTKNVNRKRAKEREF